MSITMNTMMVDLTLTKAVEENLEGSQLEISRREKNQSKIREIRNLMNSKEE